MEEDKQILLKQLGDMLGFEDGAEDVLDHLLTIDSSEDLLDYLSQLLGSSNDKVKSFVENVCAFQRGESLKTATTTTTTTTTTQIATASTPPASYKSSTSTKAKHAVTAKQESKTSTANLDTTNNHAAGKTKDTTISNKIDPVSNSVNGKPQFVQKEEAQTTQESKQKADPPVKKSVPQRGKASFVCGCFGTKHKTLANCLVCGRISCQKEGYNFCPFCGFLVEKPPEGVSRSDKAWLHKERLLQFDREATQRMVVIDDQADYGAVTETAWLTQEESEMAQEKQAEREQNLRHRPKMQLDLAL